MKIQRIQVEEGFLDGLDLTFTDGLNVIIGPRGTGKTSIIELIRFCMGIEAYSREFDTRAREHALAILGSGEVTLTVELDGQGISFSRTAEDITRVPGISLPQPHILSQNEIESIGLQESGRIRLIDSFLSLSEGSQSRERALLSDIASLSAQMNALYQELHDIDEETAALSVVPDQLLVAEADQQDYSGVAAQIEAQRSQLAALADQSAAHAVKIKLLERVAGALLAWYSDIVAQIQSPPTLEAWPSSAGGLDELAPTRALFASARAKFTEALATLDEALSRIAVLSDEASKARLRLEKHAREMRTQIEQVQEGEGARARRVAELKERRAQLDALSALRGERQAKLDSSKTKRDSLLSDLDGVREQRFERRTQVAQALTTRLSPAIEVGIVRSAAFSEYQAAIAESLRGSGLHYNTLAPLLAARMSPRELVDAIENGDSDSLASFGQISKDRAERLIAYARGSGVQKILTAPVEDGATLSLLVGSEYKPTEQLSTGQRCTVVLPILLSEHGRVLVIDQPEDHLDNAFIVDTVVKAMIAASAKGQIVCSTHNPNIPVLGDAQQVILLGSDGTRGFVKHVGPLEAPQTVEAITTVMEGGRDAFLRRAEFYSRARFADG